ncbi:MAG: hypothetical protein RIB93_11430 [Coleofasciculus sp. D1-CHI-01]|uniref:hypothetical protein n=1 Tax=Coleofasciculus sp. D1-CHI-01 TaxID=3068482 RepID=UPI0032FF2A07
MNYPKKTWQLLGFTTIYSLALTIFPKVASANQSPSVQGSDEYQIAQMNDCREVDVNTMLNIRQQPNGWVPIERPIDGYVSSANLGYCYQ